MNKNTELIKKAIKKELKRNRIPLKFVAQVLNLKPRFFSEMTCIKIDRLQDIADASGLSLFNLIEDPNFKKYYNSKGELIKIEKICSNITTLK